MHAPDPLTAYRPGLHCTAVAFVDPAAHAYPAGHAPLHDDDVAPLLLP